MSFDRAVGCVVTASSGKEPNKAVDVDSRTAWVPDWSGPAWLEVDLGQLVTFDRAEIHIENPRHRRGQGIRFDIQLQQTDGSWRLCYPGQIFGSICGKRFEPVTARSVRLTIDAAGVRQFDLFRPTPDRPPPQPQPKKDCLWFERANTPEIHDLACLAADAPPGIDSPHR